MRALSIGLDRPDLQSLASNAAERTLLARLEYTRVQRGQHPVAVSDEGERAVAWFPYEIHGVRTGLQEGVVLGETADVSVAWLQGIARETGASLFKFTRSMPDAGAAGAAQIQRTRHWTVVRRAARAREVLPLGSSYEQTLAGFGKHTRRNIRLARKGAETEKLAFEVSTDDTPISDRARRDLARKTKPAGLAGGLASALETYADATGRPFRTVVRAPDGAVVSYCCGYFGGRSAAYLLYQLNDAKWNEIGPSLLHRSFLIEWVLGRGCEELVFVHGCSGILHHACVRQKLEEIWLMRRSVSAYLIAAAIGLFKPKASVGRLARLALSSEFGLARIRRKLARQ